ncbi:four helix bundle protein [Sphingobacterium wenxiniae]|uniref:Four helix bundle protein n=1 Tax=Sphingobacterium wenxiniae TaxID=683125 RepID=A0A1I6R9X7_9SPHI|nr:four helix bundle protein [Sphingobacterium wenxiniae]SFS61557.1 four helix bundle protein [Sphingobacterium wenxiniae]
MHKFKELKVWQKAMDLTEEIYACTSNLPDIERFTLLVQVRRCAVSVPSNIAEGAGRNSKGEFIQFLGIANGSVYELQTQIELLKRLKYIDIVTYDRLDVASEEIQKMIYKLIQSLK